MIYLNLFHRESTGGNLRSLLMLVLVAIPLCVSGINKTDNPEKCQEGKKVYGVVSQMPAFPGGQGALFEWLGKNVVYPADAKEVGVQGRVIVAFVVECDGSISNVRVVKTVYPSLDKEAIRVVSSMPKWIPGRQGEEAVPVEYTLPVSFRL